MRFASRRTRPKGLERREHAWYWYFERRAGREVARLGDLFDWGLYGTWGMGGGMAGGEKSCDICHAMMGVVEEQ